MSALSSSARRRRGGPGSSFEVEVEEEPPTGLPLIKCTRCNRAIVLELVAKRGEHKGRRFFKCPYNEQFDPTTCNFFMFRPEYERLLQKKGMLAVEPDVEAMQVMKGRAQKSDHLNVGELLKLGRAMVFLSAFNSVLLVVLLITVWAKKM